MADPPGVPVAFFVAGAMTQQTYLMVRVPSVGEGVRLPLVESDFRVTAVQWQPGDDVSYAARVDLTPVTRWPWDAE